MLQHGLAYYKLTVEGKVYMEIEWSETVSEGGGVLTDNAQIQCTDVPVWSNMGNKHKG